MLSDVKTGEEGSKPTRTLFMVSCASLVLSILLLLICVLVILKTRKKRPFFLNLFLGSQYAFFTLTLILYLTVKAMVDYEIENGREEGYEEDYGTICCIVYFLWSGTSLNALAMCIILRASSVWKRSRAILSLAIQGICLLIIPGIMIGLCIHFSTDGPKSFGTALNALLYIEGKEWSWDIEKDSEAIILILYLSITFTIFLIIGGAFLFKMCRRIYKGIRMKDMGIPGIFPDQIICSSEVDMFKYKITFLPLGFYLLTGYLFIVSQTTNDYEALDSVCFLIPLGFLFLSNLYCIYLFFTFSLRRFEENSFLRRYKHFKQPSINSICTLSDGRLPDDPMTLKEDFITSYVHQATAGHRASRTLPPAFILGGKHGSISLEDATPDIHEDDGYNPMKNSMSDLSQIQYLQEDSDQEDYTKLAKIISSSIECTSERESKNFSQIKTEMAELDTDQRHLLTEILDTCRGRTKEHQSSELESKYMRHTKREKTELNIDQRDLLTEILESCNLTTKQHQSPDYKDFDEIEESSQNKQRMSSNDYEKGTPKTSNLRKEKDHSISSDSLEKLQSDIGYKHKSKTSLTIEKDRSITHDSIKKPAIESKSNLKRTLNLTKRKKQKQWPNSLTNPKSENRFKRSPMIVSYMEHRQRVSNPKHLSDGDSKRSPRINQNSLKEAKDPLTIPANQYISEAKSKKKSGAVSSPRESKDQPISSSLMKDVMETFESLRDSQLRGNEANIFSLAPIKEEDITGAKTEDFSIPLKEFRLSSRRRGPLELNTPREEPFEGDNPLSKIFHIYAQRQLALRMENREFLRSVKLN